MHTPTRNGGVGEAAKSVAEHASQIARLEVELAVSELKRKAMALGIGAGLLGASLVLGLLMLGFLFSAAAAAIALVIPWWAALLAISALLMILASVAGLVGAGLLKRGSPPVPQETIRQAKLTAAALKR